jgi:hypothetical protein
MWQAQESQVFGAQLPKFTPKARTKADKRVEICFAVEKADDHNYFLSTWPWCIIFVTRDKSIVILQQHHEGSCMFKHWEMLFSFVSLCTPCDQSSRIFIGLGPICREEQRHQSSHIMPLRSDTNTQTQRRILGDTRYFVSPRCHIILFMSRKPCTVPVWM